MLFYFTDVVRNDMPYITTYEGDKTKRLFESYQVAYVISISGGSYLSKARFTFTICTIILVSLILMIITDRLMISSLDFVTLLIMAIGGSK